MNLNVFFTWLFFLIFRLRFMNFLLNAFLENWIYRSWFLNFFFLTSINVILSHNVMIICNFRRNNESIFSEFAMQDSDLIGDVDFGADITGKSRNIIYLSHVHYFFLSLSQLYSKTEKSQINILYLNTIS